MKLSKWLTANRTSNRDFATRIGVAPTTVRRYLGGDMPWGRLPDRASMVSIYVATRGEVTPNDFFDMPYVRKRKAK